MNEIIVLIMIIIQLLTIFSLYKIYDKRGLYFSLILWNIISFIMAFKIIVVFKMNINMGIISLISNLSIIYIFLLKYDYKEIKQLLKVSLYSNVIAALFLTIMIFYIPAITETISINMQGTFQYNYKILIAYPIIVSLSQFIIAKFYQLLMNFQHDKNVCIILTYFITSTIYTIILYCISYIDVLKLHESLFIGVSSYIIGIPITIINLALINYITKKKVIK